jgi:hypothetical protein
VEKGDRPVRLAEALDLAEILGVTLSDLAELPAGVEDERAARTLALALSDRYQYAIGGVAAFIKAHEELVNFAQQEATHGRRQGAMVAESHRRKPHG